MKRSIQALIALTTMLILISSAGNTVAQGEYRYRAGKKYPDHNGLFMKSAALSGRMAGFNPLRNERCSQPASGKQTVHPDSMVSYSKYEGYTIRQTYSYSDHGTLQVLLTDVLLDSIWMKYEQSAFTHDHKGNILTETDSYWDGNVWIDYLAMTYTYSKNGLCTSLLYEDILGEFTELVTMYYDNKKNRILEIGKYWDGEGYVNLEKWSYSYNKYGDRLTALGQMWDGTFWTDYMRETWTYLSANKWLTDKLEYSDGVNWSNYLLYKNKYNHAGYRASYTGSYWYEESGWVMEFGGRFSYDARGNMVSNVQSFYAYYENPPYWILNDSTATKFNYRKKTITGTGYIWTGEAWVRGETRICIPFNDNGNAVVFANEYPSNLVNVFYSAIKPGHGDGVDKQAETALTAESVPFNDNKVTVNLFPNPVAVGFRVTVQTPVAEHFVISLYDMQGNQVQEIFNGALFAGQHVFDVASIKSPLKGLYFLKVVSPSQTETVRLVRE